MLRKFYFMFNSLRIVPVEITRETEDSVFLPLAGGRERRQTKVGKYDQYCDTWEDARQALLDHARGKIQQARRDLHEAHTYYGSIKGLKPPAST
jgi:hypothetical protein